MTVVNIAKQAALDLENILSHIDNDVIDKTIEVIDKSEKIFIYGAGRSLLMLKAFAMRLMHCGYTVHIVNEVLTPAFSKNDLLILASGSGETKSIIHTANTAKSIGGKVICFTIFENSSLANISDHSIIINAYTDKLPISEKNKKGILAGGSMFEQAVLILGDSLVLKILDNKEINQNKPFAYHANLE